MHSFIAKTNGVEPDNNSEVEKCVQNLVMRYLLPYKNNGWQKNQTNFTHSGIIEVL